eukprot:symbB.v1.2.009555.t1/scaffold604.1/size182248/13
MAGLLQKVLKALVSRAADELPAVFQVAAAPHRADEAIHFRDTFQCFRENYFVTEDAAGAAAEKPAVLGSAGTPRRPASGDRVQRQHSGLGWWRATVRHSQELAENSARLCGRLAGVLTDVASLRAALPQLRMDPSLMRDVQGFLELHSGPRSGLSSAELLDLKRCHEAEAQLSEVQERLQQLTRRCEKAGVDMCLDPDDCDVVPSTAEVLTLEPSADNGPLPVTVPAMQESINSLQEDLNQMGSQLENFSQLMEKVSFAPPSRSEAMGAHQRCPLAVMLRFLCISIFAAGYAQSVQVDGSGTTNPSKFFWKLMEMMEARTLKDIRLTYRAVGSSTGQREFTQTEDNSAVWTAGLTDFGAGDIPMSSSRYAGITGASREMIHVPFCLGAIGVFHSVPAGEVGDSKGLKLSPCVQGSGGMAALIKDTPYAIGYLDAGHGHNLDFQEVNLQNEANTWLTSKDALAATDANGNNGVAAAGKAAVDANDIPSSATADWSSVNLYRKAGTNTWPIVLVSYLYLHKDWSCAFGMSWAFVDMVMGSEGQGMLSDFSFTVVPAAMNTWATVWTNTIDKPAGFTAMTFEPDTQRWTGQGQNVVSSKRNSYSLWKLDDLESAATAMKARLDAMELHLNDYGIIPLHGSGTTNPKNWFAKAMKVMEERARVPLFLTYRAVGSSTGQKEFVGDSASSYQSYNHFGAGDIPMSQDRYNTLTQQSHRMVHIPFALGAIAVFHSVPTGEIGGASLKLDACLLAKIFGGAITTWDHADIKAQNPNINVPANQAIHVFHRRLGSSSTGGITGYLNKKCPQHWTLGAGSSVSWPTTGSFQSVDGSPGMQSALQDNKYGIGYLDAGHGIDFGLSEVALTNLAGKTRTAKESIALGGVAEAGTAAANAGNVFPSDVTADWSSVNLYDMAGDSTWPIVLVSYLYVKKDHSTTNPKTAAALQAFIQMILDDSDGMAEEFGFTPPSATLKALSLSAAGEIMYPTTMQSFTVESSTNAYGGMGVNVISMKRHSYDIYDSDVMKAAVSKLQTSVTTLETSQASGAAKETPDSTLPVVFSVVALVISLLGAFMACFAFFKASASSPAPPLPNAESGTIIGMAEPIAAKKGEESKVDPEKAEKGKEVDPGDIANL